MPYERICPQCGQPYEDGAQFCPYCAMPLMATPVNAAEPAPGGTDVTALPTVTPAQGRQQTKVSRRRSRPPLTRTCPTCQEQYEGATTTCPICGRDLTMVGQATPGPIGSPAAGVPVRPKPRHRGRRVLLALAIVLGLLLLAAGGATLAYGGPQEALAQVLQLIGQDRATVVFSPIVKPIQVQSTITASPTVAFDPNQHLLPLHLLSASSPPQSASASTTVSQVAPALPATGTLICDNVDPSQSVTIPAGTSFQASNGLSYVTTASVTVPAEQLGPNGPVAGEATVKGQAAQPGSAGNIGAGGINGAYGTSVFIKNLQAFTGGKDGKSLRIVQQSNIDGLKQQLMAQLQPQVQQALLTQISSGEVQLGTFTFVPQFHSDHRVGAAADEVTVTLSVSGSGVAYNGSQYAQLAQALLQEQVAALGSGYQLVPQHSSYAQPQLVSQNDAQQTFSLQVTATGWAEYQFPPSELTPLAHALAGRSSADAEAYLQRQVPGVDPKSVSIQLPWGVVRLSHLPERITVQVQPAHVPATAP